MVTVSDLQRSTMRATGLSDVLLQRDDAGRAALAHPRYTVRTVRRESAAAVSQNTNKLLVLPLPFAAVAQRNSTNPFSAFRCVLTVPIAWLSLPKVIRRRSSCGHCLSSSLTALLLRLQVDKGGVYAWSAWVYTEAVRLSSPPSCDRSLPSHPFAPPLEGRVRRGLDRRGLSGSLRRRGGPAFPCAAAAVLPKADAFPCGAAVLDRPARHSRRCSPRNPLSYISRGALHELVC